MPAGRGETILVVEDDPSIVLGLRMNLEAEGHEVGVAGDGEEGVDVFRKRKDEIDLVILDMMMPYRGRWPER